MKRRSLITGDPEATEISRPTEMNLLILGAGTHGGDVYEIAKSLHLFQKISFLDDVADGANIIGKCRDADPLFLPSPVKETPGGFRL